MGRLITAQVRECMDFGSEVFRLGIENAELAAAAQPGQFAHVRIGEPGEPGGFLLRRPFSIHKVEGDLVYLLIRKAGKGTKWLSQRRDGEELDMIAPIGKGFALPTTTGTRVAVVAGGIGCGPLYYLLQKLRDLGSHSIYMAGGRHNLELFSQEDYESVATETRWATDDGSFGRKGFVTELLAAELSSSKIDQVMACGPEPMLKSVAAVCREYYVPCQVSVEALMACGIGVCLSCVHKAKVDGGEGYVRVCAEGPVFRAEDIIWNEGAN